MVPHFHLLDRTMAAPRVVADNRMMVVVAKVAAVSALDRVHLDVAEERHPAINLSDGTGEAMYVPLKVARRAVPTSVRAML